MLRQTFYLWKQAPFLRLIIPLMGGVLLQWYGEPPVLAVWGTMGAGLTGVFIFNGPASFSRYHRSWFNGLCINSMFLGLGMLVCWYRNVAHQQQWINQVYHTKDWVVATLQEPLSEKAHSFKAVAVVEILRGDSLLQLNGKTILYFKQEPVAKRLGYGSQVIFRSSLQPIRNAGNPASFNYQRYAAFQGIYKQVFLQANSYSILPGKRKNFLSSLLFASRETVLRTITHYIPGKEEAGLAEALLVGYKDDLDKTLVQSYSNTGVVHIIAISGMHLGLIYGLLNSGLSVFKKRKQTKWLAALTTIAGLWLFSLLAGGGPSILRSAVMFTCIVMGESMHRKTNIYNSLAASAFILLCIDPFWLWDAGFQLSYAAVLSIILFFKPIYHWLHFPNKLVDNLWKLVAVSLAAQLLTTPVSLYHFHQFPLYFIITNLLAVPLSSLIVLLEIALCTLAWIPGFGRVFGQLLHELIYQMNHFIRYMETLPCSIVDNIQISLLQVVLLYAIVCGASTWLMTRNRTALQLAMAFIWTYMICNTCARLDAGNQQQVIIYHVPEHRAIDFISGPTCFLLGDSSFLADPALENYHLKPSRILHRLSPPETRQAIGGNSFLLTYNNITIAVIGDAFAEWTIPRKTAVDLMLLSKNAKVSLAALAGMFNCRLLVFDGLNATRKVNKWRAEAAKLGWTCFYTVDNGAFVMNMD